MYYLRNIDLRFADRILLENVSFMINPGDKIGLIGRNGAGKTTLFKILSGELIPDEGKVELPKSTTVVQLTQFLPEDKSRSILKETLSVFKDYEKIKARMDFIEKELSNENTNQDLNQLVIELGELQEKQNNLYDFNPEAEAEKILKGLGLSQEQLKQNIGTLSGGKQMRVEIAKCLLQRPDILLLDEPTNHLDIESIIWFEEYIKSYPKAIILISHDEEFLNNCVDRVLHLEHRKVTDYKGTYYKYLAQKEISNEQNKSAFENQQKVIKEKERTITRFMAKATKTKMAQSMQKQLDKMERIELLEQDNAMMHVRFPYAGRTVKVVAAGSNISKAYGDNIVLSNANIEIERDEKVAFVGQNGMGKSTLLKALLGEIDIDSGNAKIGDNVTVGYYAQDQSDALDRNLTVLETLERKAHPDKYTSCRKILGSLLFSGEDVEKKVSVLSGGEKARLALACLVANPSNFLVFDEPTNHLDIQAKKILKDAIMSFEGTILLVSHDRGFLKGLSNRTIEFREGELKEHLGDIEYVLAKRKETDFRQFSAAATEEKSSSSDKPKLGYNERKKLQRTVTYLERDINSLEEEIASLHKEMENPKFYMQSDSTEKTKLLGVKEAELLEKMEAWEVASEELEE